MRLYIAIGMATEGLEPTISGQHALHLQLAVGIGFWGRATALRNSLLHISRLLTSDRETPMVDSLGVRSRTQEAINE